jgi:thiol-disulfide isomerase/thioredoxin
MATPSPTSDSKLYAVAAALVALAALFGLFVMPKLAPAGGEMVNKPAPDFVLPVVANGDQGARMKLSDLRDKVVILDFFASWCGPCGVQAPILDRVARRYGDEVVVLGINVGEAPEVARRYAQSKGLSYLILADLEMTATGLYDATTLPTIVVIDRQGNVVEVVKGVLRESALDRTVQGLRRDRS